ncbi:MAG: hypothetical protein E6K68_09200 [Nitrospirae bacterium]|nr:MAG: hypothetical protein E6K68_09200 [Nitrospirota bacterium]
MGLNVREPGKVACPLFHFSLCVAAVASGVVPTIADAHHEAIFGPQSSLLYSLDRFVSVQVFSRQTGIAGQKTQETTGVLSGGMNPVSGLPVTVTAIVPYSLINQLDAGSSRSGFEDVILGGRYRYDLSSLIEKWNRKDLDFDPFGDRFRFALANLDLDHTALLQIGDCAILIRSLLQTPVQPDQRPIRDPDRLCARRARVHAVGRLYHGKIDQLSTRLVL